MCSIKRRGASLNSIIPYTLPKLHTGKNWYIENGAIKITINATSYTIITAHIIK